MSAVKRIKAGDTVKIISGSNKGTTGKVMRVLPKENAALVEGVGNKVRHIRPNQMNPRGGKKDIQVPVSLHKLALVVDEKSGKTSRVGYVKDAEGKPARIAVQAGSKLIKGDK